MIKPRWLAVRPPAGIKFQALHRTLIDYCVNTVCKSANCPNLGECWSRGTATFLIMGSICTRNCRFCAVKKGNVGELLDPSEPERIATAVNKMGLKHVVLTSVDRDDLIDGGAGHFAQCIMALKKIKAVSSIEALIPDFFGNICSLKKIIDACPDIIGHNIETTREFQAVARDKRAGYGLSLEVLRNIKKLSPSITTKSSLMLGLGETEEMLMDVLHDLRNAGVDIITLGQYLRPSMHHLEVFEYLHPEKFAHYKKMAEEMGFNTVVSAPLARSSYSQCQ